MSIEAVYWSVPVVVYETNVYCFDFECGAYSTDLIVD